MVSICANPWAEEYCAILAAGINITGTFGALNALAGDVGECSDWLKWHPYGGIIHGSRRGLPFTTSKATNVILKTPAYKRGLFKHCLEKRPKVSLEIL